MAAAAIPRSALTPTRARHAAGRKPARTRPEPGPGSHARQTSPKRCTWPQWAVGTLPSGERWPGSQRRTAGSAWRSAPPRTAPAAARPGPVWRCARNGRRGRCRGQPGVSPAQDASLRAVGNRVMSPISARMTSAVNGPAPGSWVSTLTRGSDRARWRVSPSSRPVRASVAPVSARPSPATSREASGSGSEASQSRPGPLQHPAGRP